MSAVVNGFSCPFSRAHFNTSLYFWGSIRPRRYFSNQIGYHILLYFFITGVVLPIPVYFPGRRFTMEASSYSPVLWGLELSTTRDWNDL